MQNIFKLFLIPLVAVCTANAQKKSLKEFEKAANAWHQKNVQSVLNEQEKLLLAQGFYYFSKLFALIASENENQVEVKKLADAINQLRLKVIKLPNARNSVNQFLLEFKNIKSDLDKAIQSSNSKNSGDGILNVYNHVRSYYKVLVKELNNKTINVGPDKGKELPGELPNETELITKLNKKIAKLENR